MFITEKDLVESTVSKLKKADWAPIYTYNWIMEIFQELDLWYWIPDIVIVRGDKQNLRRKRFLTSFDASILNIIKEKNNISLSDLVNTTKSNKNKVEESIKILVNEKMISYEHNSIQFRDYESIIWNCIAIEAKLKDWKRAICQAYRYKRFAHSSYVLMPEESIHLVLRHKDMFETLNIWILWMDKDKWLNIYYTPKNEDPISKAMQILLNEKALKTKHFR